MKIQESLTFRSTNRYKTGASPFSFLVLMMMMMMILRSSNDGYELSILRLCCLMHTTYYLYIYIFYL